MYGGVVEDCPWGGSKLSVAKSDSADQGLIGWALGNKDRAFFENLVCLLPMFWGGFAVSWRVSSLGTVVSKHF